MSSPDFGLTCSRIGIYSTVLVLTFAAVGLLLIAPVSTGGLLKPTRRTNSLLELGVLPDYTRLGATASPNPAVIASPEAGVHRRARIP